MMLDTVEQPGPSSSALERALESAERLVSQARAVQIRALRGLDVAQVASRDAARSLVDWVAERLDVSPETAREIVAASQLLEAHPSSEFALADGDVSFDRAVATAALAASGADEALVEASRGHDIAGARRLAARRRLLGKHSEHTAFRARYLALQPSLDDSSWRLWGQLPAVDGRIVEAALVRRGEQLPQPVEPASRAQRHADALISISHDSLDGARGGESSGPVASIFVDADLAVESKGETGAEIAAGPRVGPAVLEEILCGGSVRVIAVDGLKPVAASGATRAIAPALRSWVLHRDGGCVVAGCASRYRLQPHHIIPFSSGGSHDPANLATLCWYHHHVAIHGTGHRLDPQSPPQRRRLLPPARGPD